MRTLASWAVAIGGASLGACEDSPSAEFGAGSLEMVLVNPGLDPVLRAPVPLLPRVPVPGPQPGQNSLSGACASSISLPVSPVA